MAFVTNQPLKGGRSYSPIAARISVLKAANTGWQGIKEIKVQLKASREDDKFDKVYLDQQETDSVARTLASYMSAEAKLQMLSELLLELVPKTLQEALAKALMMKGAPRP